MRLGFALALMLAVLASSGCVSPTDVNPSNFQANIPALASGSTYLPGQLVPTETFPEGDVQVILEGPEGTQTLCILREIQCALPSSLLASSTYQWWLRGNDGRGIVRTEPVTFTTPASTARVSNIALPAVIGPFGNLSWHVEGATSSQLELVEVNDPTSIFLCLGQPCKVQGTLPMARSFRAMLTVVDTQAVRSIHPLGTTSTPTVLDASAPISPPAGSLQPAGAVEVTWSVVENAVAYRVQTKTAEGVPTWTSWGPDTMSVLSLPEKSALGWRVQAKDEFGYVQTGPWSSMRAATPSLPAVQLGPIGETVLSVVPANFDWAPIQTGLHTVELRAKDGDWQVACAGEKSCTSGLAAMAGVSYEWRVLPPGPSVQELPIAAFETQPPVIFLHGLWSSGSTWGTNPGLAVAEGRVVIDFEASEPGIQPLSYAPETSKQGIRDMTTRVVAPAIVQTMQRAGYPSNAKVDIVAHSMGGLVGRVLQATGAGNHEVHSLVTLGTPHQGSWMATDALAWAAHLLDAATTDAAWSATINDMRPGSAFLVKLDESQTKPYIAIAGQLDAIVGIASALGGGAARSILPAAHTTMTRGTCITGCGAETFAIAALRML